VKTIQIESTHTIDIDGFVPRSQIDKTKKIPEKGKGFLRRLGPGLITGASDDESNIPA